MIIKILLIVLYMVMSILTTAIARVFYTEDEHCDDNAAAFNVISGVFWPLTIAAYLFYLLFKLVVKRLYEKIVWYLTVLKQARESEKGNGN